MGGIEKFIVSDRHCWSQPYSLENDIELLTPAQNG